MASRAFTEVGGRVADNRDAATRGGRPRRGDAWRRVAALGPTFLDRGLASQALKMSAERWYASWYQSAPAPHVRGFHDSCRPRKHVGSARGFCADGPRVAMGAASKHGGSSRNLAHMCTGGGLRTKAKPGAVPSASSVRILGARVSATSRPGRGQGLRSILEAWHGPLNLGVSVRRVFHQIPAKKDAELNTRRRGHRCDEKKWSQHATLPGTTRYPRNLGL